MKLYFFRHGIAEDVKGPEFDDSARRLTDKGIEKIEAAGKALAKLGVKPDRLYASPRIRAKQTAEVLAKALGLEAVTKDEVNFGFNAKLIEPLIADLGGEDEVMFVGHEPDLSMAVSSLVGGGEVDMKKGGMARVDVISRHPLRGTLVYVLTPRVFDVMAKDSKE